MSEVGSLSPWHWAVIAVVVILLFGAGRLPDLARSLGQSLRIFTSEVRELQNDPEPATAEATRGSPQQPDPPAAHGRSA